MWHVCFLWAAASDITDITLKTYLLFKKGISEFQVGSKIPELQEVPHHMLQL